MEPDTAGEGTSYRRGENGTEPDTTGSNLLFMVADTTTGTQWCTLSFTTAACSALLLAFAGHKLRKFGRNDWFEDPHWLPTA